MILWDGSEDGTSYANGAACYNWDDPKPCPADDFGQRNENYANAKFSYYTEYKCAGSGATELIAAVALAAIATLSVMF